MHVTLLHAWPPLILVTSRGTVITLSLQALGDFTARQLWWFMAIKVPHIFLTRFSQQRSKDINSGGSFDGKNGQKLRCYYQRLMCYHQNIEMLLSKIVD